MWEWGLLTWTRKYDSLYGFQGIFGWTLREKHQFTQCGICTVIRRKCVGLKYRESSCVDRVSDWLRPRLLGTTLPAPPIKTTKKIYKDFIRVDFDNKKKWTDNAENEIIFLFHKSTCWKFWKTTEQRIFVLGKFNCFQNFQKPNFLLRNDNENFVYFCPDLKNQSVGWWDKKSRNRLDLLTSTCFFLWLLQIESNPSFKPCLSFK